jgi:hypothetical protein
MKILLPLVAAFGVLLGSHLPASAADEKLVGNVRVLSVDGGSATLTDASGRKTQIQPGVFIRQGSKVVTGSGTTVSLLFQNGSSVSVQPGSEFSVDEFVVDPFATDSVNFQKIKNEPSKSVTKISVPQGDIIFEVAKLKKGSTFDIKTPVGTAGIRGTSGRAGRGGLALATGSASFTQPGGSSQPVTGGQQVGRTGGATAAPPAVLASIANIAAYVANAAPPNAFQGAPPNITPPQESSISSAAAQGDQAVARAAAALAAAAPQSAAEIAAVAAYFVPAAAPAIAAQVSTTVPFAAVAVTQSVSQVAPQAAQAVAAAVISAVPTANAAAVQAAASAGASQSAPAVQPGANPNQAINTGDQGSITAGQTLPGATGSGGAGSGTPPRPTPASN